MAGSVEEAWDWFRMAEEALTVSRSLLEDGYQRQSVSQSYYAMFYAAKAAITLKGLRVSKHSAVISAFGQHLAKTGEVANHLHRALLEAFDDRREADYEPSSRIGDEMAERRIQQAEEFVAQIREILPDEQLFEE